MKKLIDIDPVTGNGKKRIVYGNQAAEDFQYKLPEDARNRLRAFMDQHERGWRGVAAITDALLSFNANKAEPAPIMAIYQAVAYETGKRVVTIRTWHHYFTVFGSVFEELPCLVTISQLRLVLSEASRSGLDPLDILRQRVTEAADYGKFIPPDVYEAQLAGLPQKKDEQASYILDRTIRTLTTFVKRTNQIDSSDKQRIVDFIVWVEGLQKRVGNGTR